MAVPLSDIADGMYHVVFTSIEYMEKQEWREFWAEENFISCTICTVALDEVHTCIDWQSFRPIYKQLPDIIANLGSNIPLNMLTTTYVTYN